MATDEFNRKFHPLPAIFNHFSKTPNLGKVHAFHSYLPKRLHHTSSAQLKVGMRELQISSVTSSHEKI